MGETESRPIWPYLPYKIHADHPQASGKKYGPIGHLRRHSTPREVSGDACRVRWSGVAINATNRVHQCVFSPLSYWIHGGAAGDEYIWLFPTSAAMLDHPTRHAPPHRSCGRRWRTGPRSRTLRVRPQYARPYTGFVQKLWE